MTRSAGLSCGMAIVLFCMLVGDKTLVWTLTPSIIGMEHDEEHTHTTVGARYHIGSMV